MPRTLAVVVLAGLILGSALFNPLATTAARYSQETSLAAAAIYATLRSMSALLSVARDADVEGSLVVTSLTVSPGQVLTPLTQTLERFADIMFVVALVSAFLAVFLGPASSVGAIVAAGAMLATLALAIVGRGGGASLAVQRLLRVATALGLAFALILPLAYSLAFWWGDGLTSDAAARANAVLQGAAPEDIDPVTTVDRDILDQARHLWAVATDLFQATVDLTVAYMLKLIVLPAVLGLGGWWMVRTLQGAPVAGVAPSASAPPLDRAP